MDGEDYLGISGSLNGLLKDSFAKTIATTYLCWIELLFNRSAAIAKNMTELKTTTSFSG